MVAGAAAAERGGRDALSLHTEQLQVEELRSPASTAMSKTEIAHTAARNALSCADTARQQAESELTVTRVELLHELGAVKQLSEELSIARSALVTRETELHASQSQYEQASKFCSHVGPSVRSTPEEVVNLTVLGSGSSSSRRDADDFTRKDTSSGDSEFDEEGWSPPPIDDAALDFSVFDFDLPGTSSRAGGEALGSGYHPSHGLQSWGRPAKRAVGRGRHTTPRAHLKLPHSVRRMDTISSAPAAIASLTLPPTPPPLYIIPSTSGADRLGEDHRLVEIRLCELLAEIEQIKETTSSLDGRVAQLEHKLEETCKDL
uniref:Uncharacterized protein n=1 Tax=Oryza meridionalis TaxID=40149 RepID=A0A0E0FDI2_9ORYZ